ncbi:Serine/threonine-protein kinase [Batrachochytrium dendrobatidis]
MGNLVSNARPRATLAGIDSYVGELPDVLYEKSLGSSRFLKTIRCRHPEGLVVVKIFIKPEPSLSLKKYVKTLQLERDALQDIPNILPYQIISESDRAGYMIRQYIASNLYDRISNRPLLTALEKRWIIFQILSGVAEAHSKQIFHGDIKTENIFVTSWNWVYVADFSSFKPAYLPEDNPADFTFFFDTSSRRACYLAPERFYESGDPIAQDQNARLTAEMDVFSVGCTISELILDGTPLFTLSQLLQYRKKAYDPSVLLDTISDVPIRELVKHMIQIDPNERLSMREYISKWRNQAFPDYFCSFFHPYLASLSDPYSASNMAQYFVFLANSSNAIVADADAKIDRVYQDFERIADALQIPNHHKSTESLNNVSNPADNKDTVLEKFTDIGLEGETIKSLLPVHVHIPNFTSNSLFIGKSSLSEDTSLIFIAIVCAAIRNTLYSTSRLRGLDLLLALGIQVSDEHKLDRVVPYIFVLLTDENPTVRINALTTLTQLLLTVKSITPSDANIFPEYILPGLRKFATDSNVLARAAYAQCISSIAEISLQFLELSQILKTESNCDLNMDSNMYQMGYDANQRYLQDIIQEDVETLLVDPQSIVKRSLLAEMPRLCIFFGRQKANDVLLLHMITYLNDPDWSLRSAFYETIVGVGTFVGIRSLDEYILPLMVQALTDSEEFVVEKVLGSLTSLAELGLISKIKIKELCVTVLPLVCHPNRWIRYGVVAFLSSTVRILPPIDIRCVLYPMVKPFLRYKTFNFSQISLLESIRSPLPRSLYEQAILFASRSNPETRPTGLNSSNQNTDSHSNDRNELLVRLKDMGMSDEDKEKLFALKYFIAKSTATRQRKTTLSMNALPLTDFGRIALRDYDVTLHTVFLTPPISQYQIHSQPPRKPSSNTGSAIGVGDGRRGSRFSVITAGSNAQDSTFSVESEDIASSLASVDVEGGVSLRKIIPRPRSNTGLPGNPRRQSKTSSIGNYDLTADPTTIPGGADRLSKRISGRGKITESLTSATAADGQEKYIRKVLEKKTRELFPPSLPELGTRVTLASRTATVDPRLKRTYTGAATQSEFKGWKPKGILVAHFPEHTLQVNGIAVAPDHNFFATCSDDGTVKLWDTNRLHTNVANRARVTYAGTGGRVKAISFCENRHSIVSAATNGQIHINRVEYVKPQGSALKYTGMPLARSIKLDHEYATMVDHSESDTESLLIYGTTRGRLCALDLRTMKEAWSFQIPPHYGVLTSMTVDPRRMWIMAGTHRGVLTLWDTRFQLCINSWAHPSRSRINKLSQYAFRSQSRAGINSNGKLVAMAVGTSTEEVSVWNISTGECAEVFCILNDIGGSGSRSNIDMGNDLNRAYGEGLSALSPPTKHNFVDDSASLSLYNVSKHHGVRSFCVHPEVPFMATVGMGRKLRFWNLSKMTDSFVVCGRDETAPLPKYSSQLYGDTVFNVEMQSQHFFPISSASATDLSKSPVMSGTWSPLRNLPGMNSEDESQSKGRNHQGGSNAKRSSRQAEPMFKTSAELITSAIPRTHLDEIMDVAVTQYPHPMIITGGRDGVVKVWQ